MLECVTYAENAKIWLVGNKCDLESDSAEVSDTDISMFCEQCHGLITGVFKISCKTGTEKPLSYTTKYYLIKVVSFFFK